MDETLAEFYEEIKNCEKCSLSKSRTNFVFGVGKDDADIMFVGEAPGYYEDKQGEPFVGAAGNLLDKLLASIGLDRGKIYIANVLKCRPPGNRDPLPEEIELCKPYLFKQIELIKPKIIVTLGSFATRVILGKTYSMSKIHGTKLRGEGYYVFPIYHPAAALYARTTLTQLEKDFLALKKIIDEGLEPPSQEPLQMGLF